MPIPLGILAAAGFRPSAAGSFDLLETTVLTGSQASVEFTNLTSKYASTYQHLQIRATVRATNASTFSFIHAQLNGDTATNYNRHVMFGEGSGIGSYGYTNQNSIGFGYSAGGNSPTSSFGAIIWDLLDPFETTKFKTSRSLFGGPNGYNLVGIHSGAWRNTNSVTSIKIYSDTNDLAQYSRFSLYGLKAA
jgi:hypothetical protein